MDINERKNDIIIGLDLGQARDWTALVVVEQIPHTMLEDRPFRYIVRQMKRARPERYQNVLGMVADMLPAMRAPYTVFDGFGGGSSRQRRVTLVLDRTGVGRAVGDLFVEAALDCDLVLASITAGRDVTRGGMEVTVPKRDLVDCVRVLLDTKRLEIVPDSPLTQTLTDELKGFKYTIGKSGYISYGAGEDWREGNHDDLTLACALAVWQGESNYVGRFEALPDSMRADLEAMGLG